MASNGYTIDKKPSIPLDIPSYSPESTEVIRTPADEGLRFFESPASGTEDPIRVYDLKLEPDGGPSKDRAVSINSVFSRSSSCCFQYVRLPPAYVPYILRMTLDAGTPASRRAILKTNFPLNGGLFSRDKFVERKYVFGHNGLVFLIRFQTSRVIFQIYPHQHTYTTCWRLQVLD